MKTLNSTWGLTSAITGLLAIACYFIVLSFSLSGFIWHLNSFSIGILLGISLYCLSNYLTKSILTQIGGVLTLLGGVFMTHMLILQHGMKSFAVMSQEKESMDVFNYIQLCTDVTFDFLIGIGLILLAIQMIRQKGWWLWIGLFGILFQMLQITFNLIAFPINPESKDLIDIGPIAAIWLITVYSKLLYSNIIKNELHDN